MSVRTSPASAGARRASRQSMNNKPEDPVQRPILQRALTRRNVILAGVAGLGVAAYRLTVDESGDGKVDVDAEHSLSDFRSIPPEGGRLVTDPTLFPTRLREAPMLEELVRQGVLPPVAQRVGPEPIVLQPLHRIGRYGGTIRRAFVGPADTQGVLRFASGPDSLLYWDYEWKTVIPNIAKNFELSDNDRVLTLQLRRGMRWSDGAPFTAADILFWYQDIYLDRRIVAAPTSTLQSGGKNVVIDQIDDYTVRFVSARPYPALLEILASYSDLSGPSVAGRSGFGSYAPKHYLSQFHPNYVPEEQLTEAARKAGFANWAIFLKNRNDWLLNPELPVLTPWRTVSPINMQTHVLERNPFSVWVDTAGNQLPYVDRVSHTFCSGPEAVNFKAVVGVLDFQERHLFISKLPFLLSNRERSDYNIYLDPYESTDVGLRINLHYREDREIGDLLGNITFRRALSLATDRDSINEAFMFGTGLPSAAVPAPDNKYYPGIEWARKWAVLDIGQANKMLDSLGLTKRDRQGFRQRRDGKGRLRLTCQAVVAHFDYPAVGEMIRTQWQSIGIDLDTQLVETTLWLQRAMAGSIQLTLQLAGTDDPFTYPDLLFPSSSLSSGAMMGIDYVKWFKSEGKTGVRPPDEIVEMMEIWRRGRETSVATRIELGKDLIRRHVDQVLSIGIVSGGLSLYGIHLAKKSLQNVPRRMINSPMLKGPANALPMTFFFQ